jgi:hypothetical protein
MRNPRPCVCGHSKARHHISSPSCTVCWCERTRCPLYRPAPRTEPLRARRAKGKGPRPCVCGHPLVAHQIPVSWGRTPSQCLTCDLFHNQFCLDYRAVPRLTPLRARRAARTIQVHISADTSDFEAAVERIREVFAMDADAIHRLVRLSDAVKERQ